MALSLRRGTVSRITEEHEELVRFEIDGVPCVAYPRLTGPVEVGDDVVVNVQARELGLGSGGFDVLYVNLTRGLGGEPEPGAHVMKLPYTPLQHAVRHVEEEGDVRPELAGLPVVCCTLHSQVLPVLAGAGGLRCAYVQLAGGALPVALSDALRVADVETVAVGACFDGDYAAVSAASALLWAGAADFDAAICSIGPGIVGTGTGLGNGAVAAAEAANAARALGGLPVIAARVSDADPRERHRGLSHHTRSVVELTFGEVALAWPHNWEAPEGFERLLEVVDSSAWREACAGLPLSHMGRGPDEDPRFFEAAFAAGAAARHLRTL
jgi:hypothetical protein